MKTTVLFAVFLVSMEAVAQVPKTWNNPNPRPGETVQLSVGPSTDLVIGRPSNFVGVIKWQQSRDLSNWVTFHADSVDLTGKRNLRENKLLWVGSQSPDSRFFRVLYDPRVPTSDEQWLLSANFPPDHITNIVLKVLSFGGDAPSVLEIRFTMKAVVISRGFFVPPIIQPRSATAIARVSIAGGDDVAFARFADLEYARSDQVIRVNFDPLGNTNRLIHVRFDFSEAPPRVWPVSYPDHEHYPPVKTVSGPRFP